MIFHMSRMSPITNRRGKTLYVDDASCSSLLARVLVLTDGRHSHRLRFWIIPVGHSCLLYRRLGGNILDDKIVICCELSEFIFYIYLASELFYNSVNVVDVSGCKTQLYVHFCQCK